MIVPTTNTVNEAEWSQMCSKDISFHTARMSLHGAQEDGDMIPAVLRDAMEQLRPAGVATIAYNCTGGSMVTPVESLPQAMTALAGIPCTSAVAAIVAALAHLGVKRVAVATPYYDAMNEQWKRILMGCGFDVTIITGLGIGSGGTHEFTQIAGLATAEVETLAVDTFHAAPADALLLSCTDMPTLPILPQLEESLGVPVISSNTATLWRALRLCELTPNIEGAGRLLCETE
ncbi:MAG: maleate cis-trans isomerase [Halieaceae bacterium]